MNWELRHENYGKCYGTAVESMVDSTAGPDLWNRLGGRHKSDSKPAQHLGCMTIVHKLPSSCAHSTVGICNIKLIIGRS